MQRSDYDLPPDKPRDEGKKTAQNNGPNKPPPAPMPDDKVKPGWQGDSKDDLLGKSDMLPYGVRERPRPVLAPPRDSAHTKNVKKQVAKGRDHSDHYSGKRKVGFSASTPPPQNVSTGTWQLPTMPPPFEYLQPPAHPQHGEVTDISWSFQNQEWTFHYASKNKWSGPSSSAMPGSTAPAAVGTSLGPALGSAAAGAPRPLAFVRFPHFLSRFILLITCNTSHAVASPSPPRKRCALRRVRYSHPSSNLKMTSHKRERLHQWM